jgi:predicted anti-sigma-YlaC factor YlaD
MPLKHLTPTQWDAVDAGTPDWETRYHLATCEECRAVVSESRALLIGLRRPGHTQEPGRPQAADHPAAEDLTAYGEGVLFGAGARSIEEHLEHCRDCRDDIIVMRDVAAAGDLKETVPTEIRDQLLERVRVTSLGEWLVRARRGVGAVFSPMASGRMAAAAAALSIAMKEAGGLQARLNERSVLEHELNHARQEAEQARMMMDHATERMRDLSLRVEQIAQEQVARVAELAAARQEAADVEAMMQETVGPVLELTAADLRLRIAATDRAQPDVFILTVVTHDDQPVSDVALEVRSPVGEPTLRTTDENGQASFSLQPGESKLRLVRHGVWELQLARQS